VLNDVLDVSAPTAAVLAEPPCGLSAGPPAAALLHLYSARRVEATFLDESNMHFDRCSRARRYPPTARPKVEPRETYPRVL
jgi:hypothetical protein